jgi:hypothetical protein
MTLLECVAASLILTVIAVAAVRAAAGAAAAQATSARSVTAVLLAESLLSEIERTPYIDPANPDTLGRDAGESATDKTTFDDVDDYHGWTESPPQDSTGVAIPNMTGWSRTVSVIWSDLGPVLEGRNGDTGLKLITVNVYFNSELACSLQSLRAPD